MHVMWIISDQSNKYFYSNMNINKYASNILPSSYFLYSIHACKTSSNEFNNCGSSLSLDDGLDESEAWSRSWCNWICVVETLTTILSNWIAHLKPNKYGKESQKKSSLKTQKTLDFGEYGCRRMFTSN